MPPHMISLAVCRLQRRAAPELPTEATPNITEVSTIGPEGTSEPPEEEQLPPEISLYSDQQVILDESGLVLKRLFFL